MNQVNKKALSLFSIVFFSLILNINSISAKISFDSISNKIKDNCGKIIKFSKENKALSITIAAATAGVITYGIMYNKNKKKKENNLESTTHDLDKILENLIKDEDIINNNQNEEIIFIEQNPTEEQKEEIKEQSL